MDDDVEFERRLIKAKQWKNWRNLDIGNNHTEAGATV
jgi:hypothetical protein